MDKRAGRGGYQAPSGSADEVYEAIKALIVNGSLRSGSAISQVALAQRLGVSRTPVREALRRLQAEGWIEARHQQRMRIAAVTPDALDALYATRIFLEGTAVALTVPRMTAEDLRQMKQASQAIEWHDDGSFDAKLDAQLAHFKGLVIQYAGEGLRAAIADLWEKCERVRQMYAVVSPGAMFVSRDEHQALLRAYLSGAVDDAVFVATRHLGRTALAVISYMDPDYEPRAIRFALSQTARPLAQQAQTPLLNVVGAGPVIRTNRMATQPHGDKKKTGA
jgi:DNA-binding GntR family transcriptional regulator